MTYWHINEVYSKLGLEKSYLCHSFIVFLGVIQHPHFSEKERKWHGMLGSYTKAFMHIALNPYC